jgi:hypothetical protein
LLLDLPEVRNFIRDIGIRGPSCQARLHQGWSRFMEGTGGQEDRINALQRLLQRI